MTTLNKYVAADRFTFNSGVLPDSSNSIALDPIGNDPSEERLRVSVSLKVKAFDAVPSNISFSIVDDNTQVSLDVDGVVTQSSRKLATSVFNIGEDGSKTYLNECVIDISSAPSLSLTVNSNDPVLTDKITATYKVVALDSF